MNTTCIMCPIGCSLSVEREGEKIVVTGNGCMRGEKYGVSEFTCPKRVVTTLVKGKNGGVVSVKTKEPIPKELVPAALKAAAAFRLEKSVYAGEIVLADVAGSGVPFVATADFEEK